MRYISVVGESKPGPPNIVYLPKEIFRAYNLAPRTKVSVRAGISEVTAVLAVLPRYKKGQPGVVSANIYRALNIPAGHPLIAKFDVLKRLIRLGPILGLLTRRIPIGNTNNQSRFLQLLTQFSRELKLLTYVFTPASIDWNTKLVKGYIFKGNSEGGLWEARTFPLPQVVYDRIGNRSTERLAEVQQLKNRLLSIKGLQYFNLRYLNKLETHEYLKNNADVLPYLPETEAFNGGDCVERFLNKYAMVFLKPTNGSLGRGIIKVNKVGHHFQYRYRLKTGRIVNGVVATIETLILSLKRLTKGRSYIIQQGLNLRTYNGAPFDIRILMQKNHNGLWRRTKMLARVAKKGSITSNLSSGANPELIADVLRNVFREDPNKPGGLGNKLRKVGDLVPPALEDTMGIQFGELGLDLGIDDSGRIWLIEVNSKPYKAMETQKGTQEVVRNSVIRPLGYASFLWMNS